MVLKRKDGKSAIISGLLIGLLVQILATALIAYLIYSGKIALQAGKYFVNIALVISTTLAGIISAKKAGGKIAITAGITIGFNALVLVAMGILVFNGFGGNAIPGLLCILIGYLSACAICITIGKKTGKRKRLAV